MKFFRSISRAAGLLLLVSADRALAAPATNAEKEILQWTLQDYFRREWRNELVTYPVDAKTAANKNLSLVDANGTAHSYQWMKDGADSRIAFTVDVPVNGSSTYRLTAGQRGSTAMECRGGPNIRTNGRRIYRCLELSTRQAGSGGGPRFDILSEWKQWTR